MAGCDADRAALDARLREAARAGDAPTLCRGYRCAADRAAASGRLDEAGYFLTHAYVWALVGGHGPEADELAQALRRQGRL